MGILNATPDSFSDGRCALSPDEAIDRALRLADEGADILDIGGESSRPGATPVPAEEEIRRVLPLIEALAPRLTIPISIDTTKAEVARAALDAGAAIINDITALTGDPAMARLAADRQAGVVLMHMRGRPDTMQIDPRYDDVLAEVHDWLARQVDRAESHGIPRERIAVDPGIGFGKTFEHNMVILRNLHRFASLGCALLVGTSRKGFLGILTGRPVERRLAASVASALAALHAGADVVRVHDVAATVDAIKVWQAQEGEHAIP